MKKQEKLDKDKGARKEKRVRILTVYKSHKLFPERERERGREGNEKAMVKVTLKQRDLTGTTSTTTKRKKGNTFSCYLRVLLEEKLKKQSLNAEKLPKARTSGLSTCQQQIATMHNSTYNIADPRTPVARKASLQDSLYFTPRLDACTSCYKPTKLGTILLTLGTTIVPTPSIRSVEQRADTKDSAHDASKVRSHGSA